MSPRNIGVLGAGSFGTALAVHLAGAGGHPVQLWARDPELARRMAEERANPEYLPGVELPPGVEPTSDLAALAGSDSPPGGCPLPRLPRGAAPVPGGHPGRPAAAAGLGHQGDRDRDPGAHEPGLRRGGRWPPDREVRFAVLSGPTFAAELARGDAHGRGDRLGGRAASPPRSASALDPACLRLYSSSDVVGVELGGAAKNVIAIAAGALLAGSASATTRWPR